jgi:hypothetical protein
MTSNQQDTQVTEFIVERSNLRNCKIVRGDAASAVDLQAGQVQLAISAFAFTANNVTYAVTGDMLSYWSFFPAEPGWGKVPVWGFGDVTGSRHDGVAVGERVFGYFPMSTHLVVQPAAVRPGSFVDGVEHRQGLPAIYNQYSRVAGDPSYDRQLEDQQMLFRPLFMTAFLIDDLIADNGFFGARAVILSSASSKTAIGVAHLVHARGSQCEVIGLTSPRHVAFVEGLGCYNRVVTYDRIASLPANLPVVFVDMAGDSVVVHALHHHFRDNMKYSCVVGLTHWDKRGAGEELPGAPPTFFFAPTQLQKRTQDWGPDGLQKRYGVAWQQFVQLSQSRIRVIHGYGPAAVEQVYLETLDGRSNPDEGHILSLRERV